MAKKLTPLQIRKWTIAHAAELTPAERKIAEFARLTLETTNQKAFTESKAAMALARRDMQAFADLVAKYSKR